MSGRLLEVRGVRGNSPPETESGYGVLRCEDEAGGWTLFIDDAEYVRLIRDHPTADSAFEDLELASEKFNHFAKGWPEEW